MKNPAVYSNIQKQAKALGVTINYVEKQAKLSTGSMCKWNDVSPTVRNLKKVADVLHCTVDDLLQ